MSDRRPSVAAATLLVVVTAAAVWWMVSGLEGRSVSTDDGISVLAADSIVREGVPRLPSGLLYNRAYLAHGLLAASRALFGGSDVGLVLPAWLAGVATLGLVGRAGWVGLGRPWASVLAAALVGASGVMTWYAASPRMYGLLVGFSAWTLVAGWRGFVRGEPRQQAAAVWATALGLQCERGAGLVLLGVGLGALLAEPGPWLARGGALWRRLRWGAGLVTGLVALGASAALAVHRPADALRPIVVESGNMPDFFELSFAWSRAAEHLAALDGVVPFLVAGVGAATVAAAVGGPALRYAIGVTYGSLVPVVLLSAMIGERIVLFVLPAAALAVALAVEALVSNGRSGRAWLVALVALGSGLGAREAVLRRGLSASGRAHHFDGAFVWPDLSLEGRPQTEALLRRLAARLAPDDRVLSSNPWTSAVYLPRTDGIVRQRRIGARWVVFDEPRDEYFGTQIFDELAEVDALLASAPGEVWLVSDFKLARYTSRRFAKAVLDRFEAVDAAPGVSVLRGRRPSPE